MDLRDGIIEARMKLTLLREDETAEGHRYRRMLDLPLVRDASPFFALSWTVMHPIDEASPFHGMGPDDCRSEAAQTGRGAHRHRRHHLFDSLCAAWLHIRRHLV